MGAITAALTFEGPWSPAEFRLRLPYSGCAFPIPAAPSIGNHQFSMISFQQQGIQWLVKYASYFANNQRHTITAFVDIPEEGAEGVLLSHGGNDGGYSLYVQDNKLKYVHNYVEQKYYEIESNRELTPGAHELRFEFEKTGDPQLRQGKGAAGIGQLYIDGVLVGAVDMPVTTPFAFGLTGGVTCGADNGAPVTPGYKPPFVFTGKMSHVTVDVSGEVIKDAEATMRAVMAHQ